MQDLLKQGLLNWLTASVNVAKDLANLPDFETGAQYVRGRKEASGKAWAT